MYFHGAPATQNALGYLQKVVAKNAMQRTVVHLMCADGKGLCRTKSNKCILLQEVEPLVFGIGAFLFFLIFLQESKTLDWMLQKYFGEGQP